MYYPWIIGGALLFVIIWFVWTYNALIRLRNLVKEAWSGIDVQLKRRHDLIPQLVKVVEGYTDHEKKTLERVTELRNQTLEVEDSGETAEIAARESALSQGIKSLLAVSESYPDLKANSHFMELHHSLVEVEDHLQMARRYFNGTVRDYNIKIESIPSNLVASMGGFTQRDYFELETALEREKPEVDL